MIDSTGEHTVACVTDDGVEVPGFTVLAIDVQIAAARAEGAMRGVTSEASFTLDASIPLPRRVWVEAPAGFLVDTPRAGATPGQWTVSVHPDQDAPAEASLRVMAEAGLEGLDTENLRPHYARTLWAWSDALESRLDEAARTRMETDHGTQSDDGDDTAASAAVREAPRLPDPS